MIAQRYAIRRIRTGEYYTFRSSWVDVNNWSKDETDAHLFASEESAWDHVKEQEEFSELFKTFEMLELVIIFTNRP
jgi:hypothetical protein